MKRSHFTLFAGLLVAFGFLSGCDGVDGGPESSNGRDYRQDMRDFVQGISGYAKGIQPNFFVIPQNGQEVLTEDGTATGTPVAAYISAIDGIGREDLFYGYDADNVPTSASDRDYLIAFLDIAKNNGIKVLVTDYVSTTTFMDDSYTQNANKGYISFAADHRELDDIPAYPAEPYNVNFDNITSLSQAKNFLYLLNSNLFATKGDFLTALQNTNYDVYIMDLFYEDIPLTPSDVASLKVKVNGGSRLVISYMSIGEAENYRYYWQAGWGPNNPSWIAAANPDFPDNYKVRYWDPEWQAIIYGNDASYLKKILDAGFDGVYLDIIDAFEYFEN